MSKRSTRIKKKTKKYGTDDDETALKSIGVIEFEELENDNEEIRPSDSISQVGASSTQSATSSVQQRRIVIAVTQAKLQAEMQAQMDQQELELEEFRLTQKKKQYALKAEMYKLEAEQSVILKLASSVHGSQVGSQVDKLDSNANEKNNNSNSNEDEAKVQTIIDKTALNAQQTQANVVTTQSLNATAVPFVPTTPALPANTVSSWSAAHFLPITSTPYVPNSNPIANFVQPSTQIVPHTQSVNVDFTHLMLEGQRQQHELIDSIRLPQTQAITFDGDCLRYYSFIRSFDNLLNSSRLDDASKLVRLVQCCQKDAKKVVESCLILDGPTGYARARNLLQERFGNPYRVAQAWVTKILAFKSIRPSDSLKLQEYADELSTCYDTLLGMDQLAEVSSQNTLFSVIEKLPVYLQARFKREVLKLQTYKGNPTFLDVVNFVKEAATEATHPVYGALATSFAKDHITASARSHAMFTSEEKPVVKNVNFEASKSTKSINTTSAQSAVDGARKFKPCALCSAEDHNLFKCPKFKELSVDDRWSFIKEHKLCFNCFKPGHAADKCRQERVCGINGCTKKHAKFLHKIKPKEAENEGVAGHIGAGTNKKAVLPIVPVTVSNPASNISVNTFALLDGGSNSTFCTQTLADKLQATGDKEILKLTTMENTTKKPTKVVSLHVSPADERDNSISLRRVYVKEMLPINISNKATITEIDRLTHLKHLPIPFVEAESVELLIGQDNPAALCPLDIIQRREDEAYAVKTKLGWTINGPVTATYAADSLATVNFAQSENNALSTQVEKFWTLDRTPADDNLSDWSQEDQKVIDLWEATTTFKQGHYEVQIPFKNEISNLHNNECVALQRLNYLRNKLIKNNELHQVYSQYMMDMLNSHYCELAPTAAENQPTWYIPHHAVFNENKPGKLRVVYDCSAKYKGMSINDVCSQGPDLTSRLIGVLLRFRLHMVALIADIERMFHQVGVPVAQRDYLRFLWWPNGDLNQRPIPYRMKVHPFGGVWAPSACNFALQKTAHDHTALYSTETVSTVAKNFYVDDCIKSVPTTEEAMQLVSDLKSLLAAGGFKLTKWLTNTPSILKDIPVEDRSSICKEMHLLDHHTDKALGVKWAVDSDILGIVATVKVKPTTRKGLLSIVSSVFDPLGLVGPFVVTAKLLLQELCRRQLGWDDPIPDDVMPHWEVWLQELQQLAVFRVPRCVSGNLVPPIEDYQLHVFCDASAKAYGAVCYLRSRDSHGQIMSNLLIAKNRLAPLRTMTIPRLELSAAVTAAKLSTYVKAELDITLHKVVLWTDSTTVLYYINNDTRRYQIFVANRITSIRSSTETNQWRYISTKLNPADYLSRGMPVSDLLTSKLWLHGPEFLVQSENAWPAQPVLNQPISDDQLEIKKENWSCHASVNKSPDIFERIFAKHSTFYKLKKVFVCLTRVKAFLLARVRKNAKPIDLSPITVNELRSAEKLIIQTIQKECYPEYFNSKPAMNGSIAKLEPIIVNDVLCVGGRTNQHQIIIPKRHLVAKLIAIEGHVSCAHMGVEYVHATLRTKYWIVGARCLIKNVQSQCRTCRIKFPKLLEQRMGNLPSDRLTPDVPPFSTIGIDFFGPIIVKQGRNDIKRYGCVFTCFSSRAIHLEMAESLDTGAFINAFTRFTARRNKPSTVYSDNGTNFVGAQRELKEAIHGWNQSHLEEFMRQRCITWHFNPPAASHMGGVWERMIRTIRRVLHSVTNQQRLTDDSLSTLLCLVEDMINSRPITTVSSDHQDLTPLTPNHLLRLSSNVQMPIGVFNPKDVYSRRRWRQIQYLANLFWQRWIREYLPLIQLRSKWLYPRRNIKSGDVVLILGDNNLIRNNWLLGRVLEAYVGPDGLVRSAKIHTAHGDYIRPIHKLSLVEAFEEET